MPNKKPQYSLNMQYLRRNLKMTRQQAADMAGIKERTWSSYEEGRAFPNWRKLPGICKVLQYFDVIKLITSDLTNEKIKPTDQIYSHAYFQSQKQQ